MGPFAGEVKEWSDDEGWGVLVSPELQGTVFAHHVHIRGQDGYRTFEDGDPVVFETDGHPGQDGCDYRALWVARMGDSADPVEPRVPEEGEVEGGFTRIWIEVENARSAPKRPKAK